jgi:hypothetical protein
MHCGQTTGGIALGDQQLHGVAADIDDGDASGSHG